MLRLNLGCGAQRLPGYINVDKYGEPDVQHDLECFPWPWADDSVGEVVMNHVLEHLGHDPQVYLGIMKELYRVCSHGATVHIVVPHHRHDFFHDDPTHVRAITPLGLSLFSQRLNRDWLARGGANTPLGLYLGIDFELVETRYKPGALWYQLHPGPQVDLNALLHESALCSNLIEELHMRIRPLKPPGSALGAPPSSP
jgi:hypothetical protein